ncbi:MAG: crossover junction endodeoxyribonuclease RuvC [Ruminococcaceae bacterium]|nr:crossover junction endodeoxyribonuclease RuvC [Oscillospiraceae bacterium]
MLILGIDPGLAIVGWGLIEYKNAKLKMIDCGAITTPAGMPTHERLASIDDQLEKLLNKYNPDELSVEELFFNTNITTGIRVAEARGVILCRCQKHGMAISEYTPLQIKQAVVGYGRAGKNQVIKMVTMLLNLPKPPKPDDTADALAAAICHAHSGSSRLAKYYNLK